MNQLDNVLATLQEWGNMLFGSLSKLVDQYGFYIVIAVVIGAVAKVFNFKIKI